VSRVLALALLFLAPMPASAAERTNVVLILCDYGGYGDFEPYGARDVPTPQIARLAREGVRLTDAYAAAPICTPARVALLTGRYHYRTGLETNVLKTKPEVGLAPAESTLVRSFKAAGYTAGMFGKWHLGYAPGFRPRAHGFDEFFGFLDWTIDYYSHRTFDGDVGLYDSDEPVERAGYITDLLTDRAVGFVRQHAREPFFLYVAYNAPLPPCQPPGRPDDVRTPQTWDASTRADYVKVIGALDAGVGRIVDAVDRAGLRDRTLVIFSYDHGGRGLSRNAPLFHGFGTIWEGGVRVACILRWPGRLPQGKVSRQAAISMDLTASMLAAAGVAPVSGPPLDGIDLLPIFEGKAPPREREFFWRLDFPARKQKALRRGKWKYIRDGNNDLLFDLETDISERNDLIYRFPDVMRDLKARHAEWEKSLTSTGAAKP
jgi:arylsulfatase A-like enzyme